MEKIRLLTQEELELINTDEFGSTRLNFIRKLERHNNKINFENDKTELIKKISECKNVTDVILKDINSSYLSQPYQILEYKLNNNQCTIELVHYDNIHFSYLNSYRYKAKSSEGIKDLINKIEIIHQAIELEIIR